MLPYDLYSVSTINMCDDKAAWVVPGNMGSGSSTFLYVDSYDYNNDCV